MIRFLIEVLAVCLAVGVLAAEPAFLRNGDRWLFTGDSITNYDTYRQTVERVFRHFHPEADVEFWNVSQPGVTSSFKPDAKGLKPTILSIMLGMNNCINSNWRYGMPAGKWYDDYRRGIQQTVREAKAQGVAVILFTPTLTDESYGCGFYELRGSREFIRQLGVIIQEIAKEENVYWVPVQEEFETFQQTRLTEQALRWDGVHPSALGQYQIARTLIDHLNLAGPLAEKDRALAQPKPPLPVKMALASRFLTPDNPAPVFQLSAEKPIQVKATWSLQKARGTETLQVTPEGITWKPTIPAEALALGAGELQRMIIDLQAEGRMSLYIADLLKTRVAHLQEGKVGGIMAADADHPEGRAAATWQAEVQGKALLVSGEVFDNDIQSEDFWPFGRDGVQVWLDLRPTPRFADIGLDEDVSLTILEAREQPKFCLTLNPWVGRGMHLAAENGGEKTPTGYRWWLYVYNGLTKYRQQDFAQKDFVGLNLVIQDKDKAANGFRVKYFQLANPSLAMDHYPNGMLILDLKNKLPFDEVVNCHLYGP